MITFCFSGNVFSPCEIRLGISQGHTQDSGTCRGTGWRRGLGGRSGGLGGDSFRSIYERDVLNMYWRFENVICN